MKEFHNDFLGENFNSRLIGCGCRSRCYLNGNNIVKEIFCKNPANISGKFQEFSEEYLLLKKYISPYVTETQFSIANGDCNIAHIFVLQEYIRGISLRESTELILKKQYDGNNLIDFYRKCLNMYKSTHLIPDLYGRPHVTCWYTKITDTPNVICKAANQKIMPFLVDVGIARLSKNLATKNFHNEMLASSIQKQLEYLESL